MKSSPSAVSRVSVQVVLFDSRSTSPDCSAVKRCWGDTGRYLTFSESPNRTAETARQTSTSSPDHLPWLSTSMKPARPPAATPQINSPRALTASRSLPARAGPDGKTAARPIAIARNDFCIASPLFFPIADTPRYVVPRSTGIDARGTERPLAGTIPGAAMQDRGHGFDRRLHGLLVDLRMRDEADLAAPADRQDAALAQAARDGGRVVDEAVDDVGLHGLQLDQAVVQRRRGRGPA